MTKEIILLACSKKYGRYCVAGIDTTTGKWLRLISRDSAAHYAIDAKDLILDDGSMAQKLDKVCLEICDKAICYFQTENYVLPRQSPWRKTGSATIQEVIALHPPNQTEYIFYDTSRRIPRDFYASLNFCDIHSLLLISPEAASVLIKDDGESRRIALQIVYKKRTYEALPVTDLEFIELCSNLAPGSYPMHKKGIMLCSVGECFEKDQNHYKLVAGIMLEH